MNKILRVFISSTFNDFRLERAVLQKFVFPELKNLAHKKGISFLPIDLRWGVPEEAQVDHRTMDICLSEVERSVTEPHPDFIILSGDKYGWVPLPRVIEKEEFEAILEKLKELNKDISILEKWYELDENQIPASYILKPRDEVEEKGKDYKEWKEWENVENNIRKLLQIAVNKLDLDEEKKAKYFISATHEEFKTFLKHKKNDKDLKNHLISFIREFKDLDKVDEEIKKDLIDENKEKIEKFREEIVNNTQRDNLKILKTTAKIYEEKIKEYSEKNKENIEEIFENINSLKEIKGNLEDEEFEEYLIEFANFIKERLKKSLKNIKTDFIETDYHKNFKNYLLNRPFIGREEEIKEILEAIKKNDKILIYGESGVGKSAIMAHIIDKFEKQGDYKIIYRFCGKTKESSNLLFLLKSIFLDFNKIDIESIKLEDAFTLIEKSDLHKKFKDISDKLYHIFEKIDYKIIIFLDAIENLKSAHIDELEWLPNNENIKIVISALKDENYKEDSLYYQKLQFFPAKIEIKRIKNKKEILSKLLIVENRTLQENQFEYILNKKDSDKPLYLTIAKEELKFWRSKDELTDNPDEETKTKRYLASTQKEIIKEFFNNLKIIHNIIPELLDKALGYISASQEHLSEELLLEVLGKDEELLSKIENKYHKNLTNELPPAVWSRFRWMIKDYLEEDELNFLKFSNRDFKNILNNYYSDKFAQDLITNLEKILSNDIINNVIFIVYIETLVKNPSLNINENILYDKLSFKNSLKLMFKLLIKSLKHEQYFFLLKFKKWWFYKKKYIVGMSLYSVSTNIGGLLFYLKEQIRFLNIQNNLEYSINYLKVFILLKNIYLKKTKCSLLSFLFIGGFFEILDIYKPYKNISQQLAILVKNDVEKIHKKCSEVRIFFPLKWWSNFVYKGILMIGISEYNICSFCEEYYKLSSNVKFKFLIFLYKKFHFDFLLELAILSSENMEIFDYNCCINVKNNRFLVKFLKSIVKKNRKWINAYITNLMKLGIYYSNKDNFQKTKDYYNQALQTLENVYLNSEKLSYYLILIYNLSAIYYESNNKYKAKFILKKALKFDDKIIKEVKNEEVKNLYKEIKNKIIDINREIIYEKLNEIKEINNLQNIENVLENSFNDIDEIINCINKYNDMFDLNEVSKLSFLIEEFIDELFNINLSIKISNEINNKLVYYMKTLKQTYEKLNIQDRIDKINIKLEILEG